MISGNLYAIADAAGYGKVRLVAEPIGALLYHLWNKDITPSKRKRRARTQKQRAGAVDMLLGGRLFDDLFFQWFRSVPVRWRSSSPTVMNILALWELPNQGIVLETMTLEPRYAVRGRLGKLRHIRHST